MDIHDYSTLMEGEKMGKVIFYDVDGTLFRRECGVPESTIRAIKKCEENGNIAILCTGRGACTLPDEIEVLPLHGRICQCGTYVILDGKVLVDDGVEGPDCQKILEILHKYDCPSFVENSNHYYLDTDFAPGVFKEVISSMSEHYPGRYMPMSMLPNKIQKMTGYPNNRAMLPQLCEELSPWFEVIVHDEYDYVEITHKDYSKGTGVRRILSALGKTQDDAIAFGDSSNDITMLDAVGQAFVMGDAPEELKTKYTPTDSIYADGIEKTLVKLGLID